MSSHHMMRERLRTLVDINLQGHKRWMTVQDAFSGKHNEKVTTPYRPKQAS